LWKIITVFFIFYQNFKILVFVFLVFRVFVSCFSVYLFQFPGFLFFFIILLLLFIFIRIFERRALDFSRDSTGFWKTVLFLEKKIKNFDENSAEDDLLQRRSRSSPRIDQTRLSELSEKAEYRPRIFGVTGTHTPKFFSLRNIFRKITISKFRRTTKRFVF
jgi:hypothetical protein